MGTVQPGWVNAHTHIYSGLAPLGMPTPSEAPQTFVQILERVWWRLDRALDRDTLRASARYYVAESLLAGTTTLIDHHESPRFIDGSLEVLADACQELGIRACLCFGATERNDGSDEARRGLAECRRFVESNDRPLVRGVVGLHASFTVSDDTVRQAAALCRDLDSVLHVHLAEDGADVDDARKRGFEGPLERLEALGALPPGSILAHGVCLDRDQVRRTRELGLWLVQNPRSNRGNGVGYPLGLAASDRVGLGTDGYPAVMHEEEEILFQEVERHGDDRAAAAKRLACNRKIVHQLWPGGVDDQVQLDNGSVRTVVVGGRPVVEEGRLVTGDLEGIRTEAEEQANRLWRRLAELPQ